MERSRRWPVPCALALLLGAVDCSIHRYDNEVLPTDLLIYRHSGMFSPSETPATSGDGRSYIKVDLVFSRSSDMYPGEETSVQVSVFESSSYEQIGYQPEDGGERLYCCSPDLVARGVCKEPYKLLVTPDASADTYVEDVVFMPPTSTVPNSSHVFRLRRTFPLTKKGLYYLLFSSCNELTGDVLINGVTEWRNPYGYLPGELYGLMPFYLRISILYLAVSFLWAVLCAKHWRELIMLQNCITAVVALGMVEMSLRYWDLHNFNKLGTRNVGLMLSAVIFTSAKKTLSRMLVLVVCMGYGVVKPSLGTTTQRVLFIGTLYFCFSAVQNIVENVSHSTTITFSQYLLLLPVAGLDVLFYFWIFRSLSITIKQLESRRQDVKLRLYLRFRHMLVFSMTLSFGWSAYYAFAIATHLIVLQWERKWIHEGFWDVIYLAVLLLIMVLWRPTENSQRYAYMQVSTFDQDDEEYGTELEDPTVSDLRQAVEIELAVHGESTNEDLVGELLDEPVLTRVAVKNE